jgi:aryl-alcohol dehydrogenase-like predicted oxidoreductase
MEYRRLGSSGLRVSVVGLGANNFGGRLKDAALAGRIVRTALEQGVNLIDTSDDYGDDRGSERFIGEAVKGIRDQLVIATKVGGVRMGNGPNDHGASRLRIVRGLEASLRTLGTDYVDLYQIHHPDPATPIDETLRALDDLVRSGKVLYIGCSNYSAWETCEALWVSRSRGLAEFVCSQPLYNMLHRDIERDLMPLCRKYNVGILPYYPLAGGFLTGKYRSGERPPADARLSYDEAQGSRWRTEENYATIGRLERFCAEHGRSLLDLAFAWLLANDCVSSVIAGASRPEQLVSNVKAAEWKLSAQQKSEVDAILAT